MPDASSPTPLRNSIAAIIGASGTGLCAGLAAWSYSAAMAGDMIFAALLVFLSWLTASAALIVTAEYGFLKFADEYQTKAQIIFIIFLLELILFGWEYNHKPIPPMTAEEIVEGVIASLPPLPYETRSEVFDKDKYVGRISSDAYDYHFGAGSRVEIGNSTAIFEFMGKPGDPLFSFIGRSDITVESINGRVLVSTKIFDQKGQFVAELIKNEWKSALYPITWDRNYSGDALEVKNSVGEIVLQVKALPDRVQLQGKWYDENGNGVGLISKGAGQGAFILFKSAKGNSLDQISIKPMFLYPSALHLGEKAPASD